jgi:hypothetical protein
MFRYNHVIAFKITLVCAPLPNPAAAAAILQIKHTVTNYDKTHARPRN